MGSRLFAPIEKPVSQNPIGKPCQYVIVPHAQGLVVCVCDHSVIPYLHKQTGAIVVCMHLEGILIHAPSTR